MCIKFAPHLHQKSANKVLNIVLFNDARFAPNEMQIYPKLKINANKVPTLKRTND